MVVSLMVDYKALGDRIKNIRIEKQLTQKELANKAQISDRYVSNIERGKGKWSIETIISIVNALETSLDNIFYDSLKNVSINNVINSEVMYNKEIKELIKDLDRDELKLMIEIIKFNKETIRKTKLSENKKMPHISVPTVINSRKNK